MRIVDLGMTLEGGLPSDPPLTIPQIEYLDHAANAGEMAGFFDCAPDDLPSGLGWAVESVKLATHSGTHLDAPWHYHPTMNQGERARTIDELPLEWCLSDGVCLDLSDREDGYRVMAADLRDRLAGIGYTLKPLDIVLIRTGADRYWGTPDYLLKGCGMGREATLWLIDQGIKIMGTDAWSWDPPLPLVAKRFSATGDRGLIWEGHFAGISGEYYHMEKMTNLDKLPALGFQVACFPIKVKAGSAGWVRPVAIFS
jgi:kynurenine formamidase